MHRTVEQFDVYKDEFVSLIREIERKMDQDQDASIEIKKCASLIPQLKMEARNACDARMNQDLMDIVEALKLQLESYEAQNNRNALLQSSSSTSSPFAAQKNTPTIQGPVETARSQNSRLLSVLQSLQETEQIAAGLSEDLGRQRETIQSTQNKTKAVKSALERGNGLLTTMQKRWFT
jgi:hypothetical protein